MRRIVLPLLAVVALAAPAGCGDPCEKLAEKVCENVKDERACERSRQDMKDFTPEICESALAIYDRLYAK